MLCLAGQKLTPILDIIIYLVYMAKKKVGFLWRGVFSANQNYLKNVQKGLSGSKKAGPSNIHFSFGHVNWAIS